jgi:glutamate-1-semialdehyde 2,1-aminomutase
MTEERLRRFRATLEEEYARHFPRSREWHARHERVLLDRTSHAIRWSDPFVPVVKRASGAAVEDLDGHRIIDYWQGHFANLLGHNPPLVLEALRDTLDDGRGLQSGMLHRIEGEVAERVAAMTGVETLRFTTSGSLGTFYAAVLARAWTGRDVVLKVSGGWHGSQPFGLKGVAARRRSFEHLESEGLSSSIGAEVMLTRFNDPDDLARRFREQGDRIACFLLEPLLGAGGGMAASSEYLRAARALTAEHGALLVCDEIITGFRFRAGDVASAFGVRPDLLVLGKVLGGGMPVAAVGGRREVLELASRSSGRVKFEGGTYSAHELSLVATRAMLDHLLERQHELYPRLARAGAWLRGELARVAREEGVAVFVLGEAELGSSLVYLHPAREPAPAPSCPEELAERAHPWVSERLFKSVLLLEGVSGRAGVGAISTAHEESDLERTVGAVRRTLVRLREADLLRC